MNNVTIVPPGDMESLRADRVGIAASVDCHPLGGIFLIAAQIGNLCACGGLVDRGTVKSAPPEVRFGGVPLFGGQA